jgi:hypothetical protein
MRRSDFEVFTDRFLPEENEDGDIKKYETYGEEYEEAKRKAGEDCKYLWTILEGDSGKWYLSPGFHLVNRMAYVITAKPWDEKTRDYKY